MSKSIETSVSILCANFAHLADEVKKCEDAGVDRIHIDVMDGFFVPNITMGPILVEAIRPLTKLPIEAHLMIENPWRYIDAFIAAGTDNIYLQAECYGKRKVSCLEFDQYPKEVDAVDYDKIKHDIDKIKEQGKKAFIVLNPGTPVCIESLYDYIDGVMVMSVNPGFAKQKFMPIALPKIEEIRAKFDKDISVDGGVNGLTAPEVIKAGANVLAMASYFYSAEKPKDLIRDLKNLAL